MSKSKIVVAAILSSMLVLAMLLCIEKCKLRQDTIDCTPVGCKKFAVVDEPSPLLAKPSRAVVDAGRREAIRSNFDAVAAAYSSAQCKVIQEREPELLESVEHLTEEDFQYVERAFYTQLYDEFVARDPPVRRFSSVEGLEKWISADFAAVQLYGAVSNCRKDYGQLFHSIEARLLKRLRGYRDMFMCEGKTEFAAVADRAIARWIDHIESDHGFTRTMAIAYLEIGKIWIPDPAGEQHPDWSRIRNKAVERAIEPLVKVGYRPKWADMLLETPEPEVYSVPTAY